MYYSCSTLKVEVQHEVYKLKVNLFIYINLLLTMRAGKKYTPSRAQNYWVSGCPGHPKIVTETQFLDQGFQTETQELSGQQTALNLGFSQETQKLPRKSKY